MSGFLLTEYNAVVHKNTNKIAHKLKLVLVKLEVSGLLLIFCAFCLIRLFQICFIITFNQYFNNVFFDRMNDEYARQNFTFKERSEF